MHNFKCSINGHLAHVFSVFAGKSRSILLITTGKFCNTWAGPIFGAVKSYLVLSIETEVPGPCISAVWSSILNVYILDKSRDNQQKQLDLEKLFSIFFSCQINGKYFLSHST